MSPRHGTPVRGLSNVPRSSVRDQRFGRLFRDLPPAVFGESDEQSRNALIALGRSISQLPEKPGPKGELDKALGVPDPDENLEIPSGYTYFGQFVDHDITFDPASSLDRFNDPDALQDFRTPRLDLDSVYGSGPDDQPFLYAEDGAHLLLGKPTDGGIDGVDLPRNRHFKNGVEKSRLALIGDKRNDENIIVSQLHSLFLRFHNRVLDRISAGREPTSTDFQRAQQLVRWHYQWIVLHDFLPRIVGTETYKQVVVGPGELPVLNLYKPGGRYAFIPVEFSTAAYRYGHSQVRPSYALNQFVGSSTTDPTLHPVDNDGNTAVFFRVPIFSAANSLAADGVSEDQALALDRANLNGFRELPDSWAIDWGYFLDDVTALASPVAKPAQRSYKIDTQLVEPLENLPDHKGEKGSPLRSLAILNLLRGWRFELPSGQSVARYLSIKKADILDDDDLFDRKNVDPDNTLAERRKQILKDNPAFADNAPLWFYILKEAEILGKGEHLGPAGGTIVAEVLAGLILADGQSFLSQWPEWKPTLPGKQTDHFTLSDLINFATGAAPRSGDPTAG